MTLLPPPRPAGLSTNEHPQGRNASPSRCRDLPDQRAPELRPAPRAHSRYSLTAAARDYHDTAESAEGFELPGADLSGEELMVRVVPAQTDEFTCACCFLVRHRSQIAKEKNGMFCCTDCEA